MHRVAAWLCVAAWMTTGSFKVIAPSPIGFAGTRWAEPYAVALGLLELLIGIGFLFVRSRAAARVAALFLLTAFLLLWSKVESDCGCLGGIQLDQAGRTVILGLLLTFHGAEILTSPWQAKRSGVAHAS